jgi:hypothetical protein
MSTSEKTDCRSEKIPPPGLEPGPPVPKTDTLTIASRQLFLDEGAQNFVNCVSKTAKIEKKSWLFQIYISQYRCRILEIVSALSI